jgi:SAM-dependent methyltransferase
LKNSYQKHAEASLGVSTMIRKPESIDAWLHTRMIDMVDPLVFHQISASYITVGDGRYGGDAFYLMSKGPKEVIASDLDSGSLKKAKELGFISSYAEENAETFSFQDNSFDYVFCKQTYHHFPRPPVAFYEMLRIARRGVILLEP